MRMILLVALGSAVAVSGRAQAPHSATSQDFVQQCLHGSAETAEQAGRRKEALDATRTINNLEANQPLAKSGEFLRSRN